MSWIKRNLFFVIGSALALVLMGLAGWFLYSKWNLNNEVWTTLNSDYEKLKSLNSKNPHPGAGQINNINLAKEQRAQLTKFVEKAIPHFAPIPRIPEDTNVTDMEFSSALSRTVEELQKAATNAGVMLQDNYYFSFQAQNRKISFAPGSLGRLSAQLGEVKTIAEILFQAKVNALDGIRRERVSTDDAYGPLTDYLSEKSTTNRLDALNLTAIVTPYEVTFRGFSPELAAVLAGFASSPHCFIVKSLNIEPAPYVAPPEPTAAPAANVAALSAAQAMMMQRQSAAMAERQAQMEEEQARARAAAAMAARYGGGMSGQQMGGVQLRGLQPGGGYMRPTTTMAPTAAAPTSKPLGTVLDEKLLKVTMNLALIKPVSTNPK